MVELKVIPSLSSAEDMATSPKLDETDRRILRALRRDGRLSNLKLAEQVGLSPTP